MARKTPPLNPSLPMVDDQGRPTPFFMRWWQDQVDTNAIIPSLETAEEISAILDILAGDAAWGDVWYRGETLWENLAAGTTDYYLQTKGAGAAPVWAAAGGTWIALSDTPGTYTAQAGKIANVNSGETAIELDTLTTIIDDAIDDTQGAILYRNATEWVALAPGTADYYLQTKGAAANPVWAEVTGGGSDLEVEDDGVSLSTTVTKINFAGDGVVTTEPVADEILVTIDGGGSGSGGVGYEEVVIVDHDFNAVNQASVEWELEDQYAYYTLQWVESGAGSSINTHITLSVDGGSTWEDATADYERTYITASADGWINGLANNGSFFAVASGIATGILRGWATENQKTWWQFQTATSTSNIQSEMVTFHDTSIHNRARIYGLNGANIQRGRFIVIGHRIAPYSEDTVSGNPFLPTKIFTENPFTDGTINTGNTITVQGDGSLLIEGAATEDIDYLTLVNPFQHLVVKMTNEGSTGANWQDQGMTLRTDGTNDIAFCIGTQGGGATDYNLRVLERNASTGAHVATIGTDVDLGGDPSVWIGVYLAQEGTELRVNWSLDGIRWTHHSTVAISSLNGSTEITGVGVRTGNGDDFSIQFMSHDDDPYTLGGPPPLLSQPTTTETSLSGDTEFAIPAGCTRITGFITLDGAANTVDAHLDLLDSSGGTDNTYLCHSWAQSVGATYVAAAIAMTYSEDAVSETGSERGIRFEIENPRESDVATTFTSHQVGRSSQINRSGVCVTTRDDSVLHLHATVSSISSGTAYLTFYYT